MWADVCGGAEDGAQSIPRRTLFPWGFVLPSVVRCRLAAAAGSGLFGVEAAEPDVEGVAVVVEEEAAAFVAAAGASGGGGPPTSVLGAGGGTADLLEAVVVGPFACGGGFWDLGCLGWPSPIAPQPLPKVKLPNRPCRPSFPDFLSSCRKPSSSSSLIIRPPCERLSTLLTV